MTRARATTVFSLLLAAPALLAAAPPASKKAEPPPLEAKLFLNLEWRQPGPASMQGRCTDVEGVPGDPSTVYVGAASGGVFKTTNAGTTWTPIFDKEAVQSIGDIALDPTNPDVIYVGTGEANLRNSVSFGDGVYKSTDGGKTWRNLGLKDTEHVARIVVSPREPQKVYVAATGHAFGPNAERGVFMSTNGGQSFDKVLYLDDQHGAADLDIDPQNPNLLFATMWRFERKPWTHTSGSERSGLYRSTDGGRSWSKVEKGLPKLVGRMGVKVAPGNPRVVYVAVEANEGSIYRSDDGGESFTVASKNLNLVGRGMYYADLRVDPKDENRVYAISFALHLSTDGGKTWKVISNNGHGDYQTLWIDPLNPNRVWNGDDGGVAVSYDRAAKWEDVTNLPLGQFYQVYADNRQPFYFLGGGLQDNSCWYGPSRTREPAGILNSDWKMVVNGDGYYMASHPDDPDLIIAEYQGGGIQRTDMRTREQQDISPQPRRADGSPVAELKYRFNWNSPIVASPHDGKVVYLGSNVLFRSKDFGTTWEVISPDLTSNDPEKQKSAGGPVWKENTTAEYHCTIISVSESPVQAGVIWTSTDDGYVQVTRDGGKSWANVTAAVPGLARSSVMTHVEASRTAAGTAYLSADRHMFDDFRPYVFKTTDYGKTWTSLSSSLPAKGYVHTVREDPKNTSLLYVGTELGLFASWNGGGAFEHLHLKDLPAVAVHDVLVHPRENDLILATHGRSLYVLDDATPVQTMTAEIAAKPATLFDVRPALRFAQKDTTYALGDREFRGKNPPYGAIITYYLKTKLEKDSPLKMEVLKDGQVVREIKKLPREAGFNRVAWDLAYDAARPRKDPPAEGDAKEEEALAYEGPPERGPRALPGSYTVRLSVGAEALEKPVTVRLDPSLSVPAAVLQEIFDDARELTAMRSEVNDLLRRLDDVKLQVEERTKLATSRRAPLDVAKALDKEGEALKALANGLAKPADRPFYSEGPCVADRLGALFSAIDGVNLAPTAAQREHLLELRAEARKATSETSDHFGEALAQLNGVLRGAELPEIGVPKPAR